MKPKTFAELAVGTTFIPFPLKDKLNETYPIYTKVDKEWACTGRKNSKLPQDLPVIMVQE